MIFGRRKRGAELDEPEAAPEDTLAEAEPSAVASIEDELAELDAQEWRGDGPRDIAEVDEDEVPDEDLPRIDLGSLILTGVPGSELRLQVSEETDQIVSAMLIIGATVQPAGAEAQEVSSALELGAYAAPRSGGLWAELRDEMTASATEMGGSAALVPGPFGVELRRLLPVTAPNGQEGYQPSRMWVVEGPRWLLRGIVYGQAAVEEDEDSPVVAQVLDAFRRVVVRRGDEAMAPGDLLPLTMPPDAVRVADS